MPACSGLPGCTCWGCVQSSLNGENVEAVQLSEKQQLKRGRTWRFRDQLLDWSPEIIEVEGEGPRVGMQKPLLLELQEQVRPSGEGGAGGAGFGPGMPVAAAALALMQDIEREVADRLWSLPRPAQVPEKLAQRIQYWVACLNDRPDLIDECYAVLGGWVQRINDLFNPPTVVRLRRKCPACNLSHVWETLDGERVQNRALVAVIRPASDTPVLVECRGCGAGWCGPSIHELEELTRPQE